MNAAMQTILVFDQIQFTKKQLKENKLIKYVNEIYEQSPNQYLKYQLEQLLQKWREIRATKTVKIRDSHRPTCVFDAIIMDDHRFFKTKCLPELLHRLLKSFDKNYKVMHEWASLFVDFLLSSYNLFLFFIIIR